jgi:large subunit ribosomal protein L3
MTAREREVPRPREQEESAKGMATTILGRKLGMSQVWSENDQLIPVTVIEAGPCFVSQVKTQKTDGYDAVQLAFGDMKPGKATKPAAGHLAKAKLDPMKYLHEMRIAEGEGFKRGQKITVDVFEVGAKVDVIGTSKGKGFAGVMKRHNFRGGPGGHGSHFHRAPGSVGMCASPSRVLRGTRLPGHMGVDTVTVKKLEIMKIDAEQNLLVVKGAVPGGKNGLLVIRAS